MPLITLTSDFGNKDFYLAVIKGELHKQLPQASIIDISHTIPLFNIFHAAFVVKSACKSFPPGTIHLIMVEQNDPHLDYVVVKAYDQYFICQDNGIPAIIFEGLKVDSYTLTIPTPPEGNTFPARVIMTTAAAHLARGGVPELIGESRPGLVSLATFKAIIENDFLKVHVQYIDHFGNLITNIDRETFAKLRQDKKFILRFRIPGFKATKISRYYTDVEQGNLVALFNSFGLLEVAINEGNASQLLGVNQFDIISIEFL